MKNLAFHSLLRWKMIIVPIPTTSLIHFLFVGWENVLFELGSEGVKVTGRCLIRKPVLDQRSKQPTWRIRNNSALVCSCGRGALPGWTGRVQVRPHPRAQHLRFEGQSASEEHLDLHVTLVGGNTGHVPGLTEKWRLTISDEDDNDEEDEGEDE